MRLVHVVRDDPSALLVALLSGALALAGCADAGGQGDDDDVADVDAGVGGHPDARVFETPDAAPGTPDAAPGTPDAAPGTPDAIPPADAAPGAADAAPGGPVCDEAALLPDNDTCAEAIDLTMGAAMSGGITTYGDTRGYANDAEPPSACTDDFGQDGPDAVYRIDAVAGDTISVSMTPEAYDGSIYILSNCMDPLTCELGADLVLTGATETLSYPVTINGSYYLFVDSYLPTVEGCYTLHVALL